MMSQHKQLFLLFANFKNQQFKIRISLPKNFDNDNLCYLKDKQGFRIPIYVTFI